MAPAPAPSWPTDGQLDSTLEMLIRRYQRTLAGYGDAHPETMAECRLVTDFCLMIGDFRVAAWYLEIALSMAQRLWGDDHRTMEIAGDLGNALLELDQPELAVAHLRRQLDFLERKDATDLATLMPRNSLAIALADTGRLPVARALLATNLELSTSLLGPDHRFTQTTLQNLASLDEDEGP